MNQDAFRNLLSSYSSSSASGSRPAFGSTQKRPRPAAGGRKDGEDDDYRKQPRKDDEEEQPERKQFGPKWNSSTGEAYVDRAAARRQGQESTGEDEEDASVRALHEEWRQKWLAADGEEARREVEEQMTFLGGDAKHSILVKGLDWALLAQQRAKAGGGGDGMKPGGDDDDDLEAAYATAARRDHEDEAGPSSAASGSTSTTKRSRQEILEALKRRKLDRSGSGPSASPPQPQLNEEEQRKLREAEEEKQRLKAKFRPIGASGGGVEDKSKKGEVIIMKDGKRLRKKVKKVEEPQRAQKAGQPAVSASSAPTSSRPAAPPAAATKPAPTALAPNKDRDFAPRQLKKSSTASTVQPGVAASPAQEGSAKPSSPAAVVPAEDGAGFSAPPLPTKSTAGAMKPVEPEDDDEDEDIFADAGRWTGLDATDDHDDENDGAAKAQTKMAADDANLPLLPALSASGRRDWFGDGDEEDEEEDKSKAAALPAGCPPLPLPPAPPGPSSQQPANEEDNNEDAPGPSSTTRLQGLSDSALPSSYSRYLLDQEKEREERKAKKREEALKERMQKKRDKKKAMREGAGVEGEGGA